MPFDMQIAISPDLSAPSLAGLSWLLRHQAEWPKGHEWDFGHILRGHDCGTSGCALGIAQLMWGESNAKNMCERMGIEFIEVGMQFFEPVAYDLPWALVTPVMVADRIDAWLAKQ